jgi:hypothetical protein
MVAYMDNEAEARDHLTARIDKVGREMAALRESLNAVDARVARINDRAAGITQSRYSIFAEAWERLMDARDFNGASMIREMMERCEN